MSLSNDGDRKRPRQPEVLNIEPESPELLYSRLVKRMKCTRPNAELAKFAPEVIEYVLGAHVPAGYSPEKIARQRVMLAKSTVRRFDFEKGPKPLDEATMKFVSHLETSHSATEQLKREYLEAHDK